MLPPRLEQDIATLRGAGWTLDVSEEPAFVSVVVHAVPTGPGFTPPTTDVLLRIPRAYPDAAPDMFWTAEDVRLVSGVPPKGAEALESYLGRRWRRFSWHRQRPWKPGADWLGSHLEFARQRLCMP